MNPEKLEQQSDPNPIPDEDEETQMSYESLLRRPNRTKKNAFKLEKFRDDQ